jgi:RsiW-degrading membrane proteinase PrsW (M82 family)
VSATVDAEYLGILVLVSLIPALIYLAWVRSSERYGREAWGPLLWSFVYGALFATLVAAVLEGVLVALGTSVSQKYPGPEFVFLNGQSPFGAFFLVLVIAPFIEEALKASGVAARRSRIDRVADGPVYGAAVGLGFGFFETFLYGLGAFVTGGLIAGIALIALRSVSSVVLHGSSTGMFGYGYGRSKFQQPGAGSGGYYLVAVAMHATFNALASLAAILMVFGIEGLAISTASFLAFIVAVAFAFGAIEHVRAVIHSSDYPALAPRPPAAARPPVGARRPPGR